MSQTVAVKALLATRPGALLRSTLDGPTSAKARRLGIALKNCPFATRSLDAAFSVPMKDHPSYLKPKFGLL
jgi:hypothetical protein